MACIAEKPALRHFVDLFDISAEEARALLERSVALKAGGAEPRRTPRGNWDWISAKSAEIMWLGTMPLVRSNQKALTAVRMRALAWCGTIHAMSSGFRFSRASVCSICSAKPMTACLKTDVPFIWR